MSKMNKIITNNSVQLSESEVNNLIVTLGPVIEAFTGGGGGQGSVIYTPGDDNISINNTQHTIALSTDAATKLNTPIPTKVSDLTDSANYATKQYVQAASAEVTGWVNNQNYLTEVPDTYYLKTETSGKDELSAAFNDILKYNVTAAAGIQVTTATDAGVKTFGISMTAEPVVTDTTLSGYSGIAATRDGEVNNQWNIGLTQDQINTINGKLNSSDFTTYTGTTAPATYQPKGDYATTSDISDMATKTWVGNQGYATSGGLTVNKQYAMTNTGWAEVQTGTSFTGVTTTGSISGGGVNNNTIGLLVSAENALADIDNKVDKPDTTQESLSNKYLVYSTLTGTGEVTGWTDFNANVYSKTESDGRYQKKTDMSSYLTTAQYETDSATFVTSSSNTITGTDQFALTTAGWTSVETAYLPTSGGTVSGATYFSAANGQNVLAVASAATLIGASRQTSGHFGQDTTALGTTWIGVGSNGMHRGFFKYTDGGDVGALDSQNMMQVEFTPSNKGQIFAKATNNGTAQPETQILNPVKTTCDNMSTSGIDANNMSGPNYMIAKNADGQFVIGAAVFNCQGNLPDTLQPNTYYFVY